MRAGFLSICLSLLGASWVMPALGAGNLAVVDQIDGPSGAWTFASIDSSNRRLYVGRTDGMLAIDLGSRKVTSLPLGGRRVQMIVPVPGSQLVVATLDEANTAALIDGRTGTVIAELPAGRGPETAALDPSSGLVAVMAASEQLTLIDPASRTVAGTIPVGAIMESGTADGHGRLYVNLEDKRAIGVVDVPARKLVASWPLGDCDDPTGLGYVPLRNWLISACGNHVAKVVNAATGTVIAALPIGDAPDAVIVDVQRRLAFIPCSEGHLMVISLSDPRPKVIASVVTAQGAATGALDPRTGRLYLPVGRAPSTAFGGREVPGFAVLVVGQR